jgi:hypothetical protein
LPIQIVVQWRASATRKSIPYQFFANHLALAPPGKGFVIFDYLAAIAVQEQRYKRDYSRFKLPPPPARKTKLSTAV